MDQELRAFLQRMEERIDARFAEQRRHTEILIESVRSDVRLVAEGVVSVSQRLDDFKAETAQKFEEIQASFTPYYRNLNGRVEHLEDEVPALGRRVTVLETRAARRTSRKGPAQ